jgi:hypothetical protein
MEALKLSLNQSEILLNFLKEKVSKWSEAKIYNILGLRKALHKGIYWNLSESVNRSIGWHWGHYISVPANLPNTPYNGYYRALQMRLFKKDDKYFLSQELSPLFPKRGDIILPKKLVNLLNFEN